MCSVTDVAQAARRRRRSRAGFSVIEITIATSLVAIVMVAALMGVQRDARSLSSLARRTHMESTADHVLDRFADTLEFAEGAEAVTTIATALGAFSVSVSVGDSAGFPDAGILLVEPGTAFEERISYDGLAVGPDQLLNLARGIQCTGANGHPVNAEIRWAGNASALENQINPPAWMFDGISQETMGPVFFRGDGTGFSYRVHTDPLGGGDFFDDNGDVQWGATVQGVDTLDGRSCYYYEAVAVISEQARAADFNADGDQADTFDLGRIRMRSWNAVNPGPADDTALCPPMILQERCNWGGDLDNDGFADPMFLWDPRSGRLRVRLFLLTATQRDTPIVRPVESVVFLRNSVQE